MPQSLKSSLPVDPFKNWAQKKCFIETFIEAAAKSTKIIQNQSKKATKCYHLNIVHRVSSDLIQKEQLLKKEGNNQHQLKHERKEHLAPQMMCRWDLTR